MAALFEILLVLLVPVVVVLRIHTLDLVVLHVVLENPSVDLKFPNSYLQDHQVFVLVHVPLWESLLLLKKFQEMA